MYYNFLDIIKFNIINNFVNNNLNYIEKNLTYFNCFFILIIYFFYTKYDRIYNFYIVKKYNHIIIEGSRCINMSRAFSRYDNLFSIRFRAIWHYIQKNLNVLKISSIKEISNEAAIFNDYGDEIRHFTHSKDIFFVNQLNSFRLAKNVYCKVINNSNNYSVDDNNDNNSNKKNVISENITLDIFSDKLNIYELNKFIDNLITDFEQFQNTSRKNKLFIYSLINNNYDNDNFRRKKIMNFDWQENEFKSNKTFDKLFFENKEQFIKQIDFFRDNEDYYNKYGIPYTLGISLEGQPGTGKTSIIKCLANYLNRHLVIINLNKIKTCQELSELFYENTYNINNSDGSINFKDKIYVFEDIDCCMDIVKQRKSGKNKMETETETESDINSETGIESNNEIDKYFKKDSKESKESKYSKFEKMISKLSDNDDKLTLGHILNLIDGIKECPGRIIILSSNYMNKIDYALKRPGRIDIAIKMDFINFNTLCDFYNFYFDNSDNSVLDKFKNIYDYKLTPANLTNCFLNNNSEKFIIELENLLK